MNGADPVEVPEGSTPIATTVRDSEEVKGDIWYFRKPAPQSERFADTVLVAHGPRVWRVTDTPERPVLGRRARQSKLEAVARDFEAASLEAVRADERRRALESDLHALDDLRLKLNKGPQACAKGLRHAYGVAAVAAGVPLPTVAAVLGHAHLTTTALYTTAIGAQAESSSAACGTESPRKSLSRCMGVRQEVES